MKKKINRETAVAAWFLAFIFASLFFIILLKGKGIYGGVKRAVKEEMTEGTGLLSMVQTGILETENQLNERFPKKMVFINIHGLFNRALGKRFMADSASSLNDVYKMDNGQLTYVYPRKEAKKGVKSMKMLKEVCDKKGASLIYVQFPFKVDRRNNQLPYGMKDTSNKSCSYFLKKMKKYSIDSIDYRKVLAKMDKEYEELFYNGDHHWRTETAFYAYVYFMEYLEKNYGYAYKEETTQEENFFFLNLPKSFIGSQTNRTGTWYGMVDDFVAIYPKFDTEFLWGRYSRKAKRLSERRGRFEDTLLFQETLDQRDVPMAYRDDCYFNGSPALVEIINEKVPEGEILFVTDSFGKPFISFASLNFHKTVFMDLRDYTGSLLTYVENNQFDYVVISYSASAYKGKSYKQMFDFEKEMDDGISE